MSDLLATWVEDHGDVLYRFALRRVKDSHAIDDILQDTFMAALKAKDSFRGDSNVRTWLISILRTKIVDHFRRQAKEKKVEAATLEQAQASGFDRPEKLAVWDTKGNNTLENQEFWGVFNRCLEKLPETLARAYLMREIDGFPSQTICETLNITADNLAVRIFRARSALRDCLDANWFSKD